MSSLWGWGEGEGKKFVSHFQRLHTLMDLQLNVEGQLTIVGLKSSLRSVKLERKRVIGVSMGRKRMIDEVGVILFNNFFHDAAK